MQVKRIIIHELKKEQMQTGSTVELSKTLLEIDDQAISLLEKLNKRYVLGRELITYGVFDRDESKTFPKNYILYHSNTSNEMFIEMTHITLNNLGEQIQNIHFAKGGYVVFADYKSEEKEYFGVFLIRNTSGMLFLKDTHSDHYRINSTIHIDLEKIAMGCRINKKKFSNEDGQYLSFTKKGQADISDYFIKWIAAVELNNNKIFTEKLFEISNHIPLPQDDLGVEMPREEFRKTIADLAKASPNSTVNLANLSDFLYKDENYISRFAQDKEIDIDTEFKPDLRVLRKFVQISIREDNIKLEFSQDDLNTKVRIDDDNPDIVIIESPKVANKVRERLESNL